MNTKRITVKSDLKGGNLRTSDMSIPVMILFVQRRTSARVVSVCLMLVSVHLYVLRACNKGDMCFLTLGSMHEKQERTL